MQTPGDKSPRTPKNAEPAAGKVCVWAGRQVGGPCEEPGVQGEGMEIWGWAVMRSDSHPRKLPLWLESTWMWRTPGWDGELRQEVSRR